jgi:hypothetical protein
VAISLLSLLATCLTPYRLKLYSFLSDYSDSFYRSHLQEWLSQFSFPFTYWQLAYLALVTLSLFLYIHQAFSARHRHPLKLWDVFLVIFFVFLSWQSRRHFPLMFVVTFLFIIETHLRLWTVSVVTVKSKINTWLRAYLLACLMLVALLQLIQTRFSADPFSSNCADYPCGATAFLQSHSEYNDKRLFNHYAWGGYLMWVWPERQLFIDGRLPQLPFAGHTYLAEYYEFFKQGADFTAKLQQYDISLVLLPAQDHNLTAAAWERWLFMISDEDLWARNRLREFLQSSPSWRKVYEDATAVVYERRN